MKNNYLQVFIRILIVISIVLLSTSVGCIRIIVTEPAEEEPEEAPPVEEPVEEIPEEEDVVNEEDLKDELLSRLEGFFTAVNEDREYEYFSSETREIVGTEEEYRTGARTDYYFIIQEAHSDWSNVEAVDIEVEDGQAFLTIRGDRTVEGMEYTDDEIRFKFVYEEDDWKIDFS